TGVARIAAIVVAMVKSVVRMRWACGAGGPCLALFDWRFEQASELAREVDGDARVHSALLVEEPLRPSRGVHAFVPDVGMNVEALAPIEAEAHEFRGLDVVARKRERHQERLPVEREEEL